MKIFWFQLRELRQGASARVLYCCCCLFSLLVAPGLLTARAQQPARGAAIVDRMIAIVNGDELITHTDLLWQMALEPGIPADSLARPRAEDLQRALQTLIDQLLILQEAEKLPASTPSETEVKTELTETIKYFPSQNAFYERIGRVGLNSEQLADIIRRRVTINKYLDFRFRAFVPVFTEAEVADYYRSVYVPRHRQQRPGQVVPAQKEAEPQIREEMTRIKLESDLDTFLEDARQRADLIILSPV